MAEGVETRVTTSRQGLEGEVEVYRLFSADADKEIDMARSLRSDLGRLGYRALEIDTIVKTFHKAYGIVADVMLGSNPYHSIIVQMKLEERREGEETVRLVLHHSGNYKGNFVDAGGISSFEAGGGKFVKLDGMLSEYDSGGKLTLTYEPVELPAMQTAA